MHSLPAMLLEIFATGLWQGLLVIALLLTAFRVLPRISPAVRCAVWVAAFLLLPALPLVRVLFPRHAGELFSPIQSHAALQIAPAWGYALPAIWAALLLFRGTRLLMHAARLRGIWRRAAAIAVAAEVSELLQSHGRRAVLCSSAEVDAPVVIGFRSPRLLLPETLLPTMSAADLEHVVLHEMEHLRRRDDWTNLLQKLALVLFPLHPALLWIDRRVSRERELACDAGVVARTAAPLRYAACLTRLAERRLTARVTALSLAAWSRRPELVRRVELLLTPAHATSRRQARVAVGTLVLLLGGAGAEMTRAPQVVALTEARVPAEPGTVATVPRDAHTLPGDLPRAVPVSYSPTAWSADGARAHSPRGTTQAHMEPAVYHLPAPDAASTPKHGGHRSAASRTQVAVGTSATGQMALRNLSRARAMLTTIGDDAPSRLPLTRRNLSPRYTLTLQSIPAYAAVPFGDGWLIVQL